MIALSGSFVLPECRQGYGQKDVFLQPVLSLRVISLPSTNSLSSITMKKYASFIIGLGFICLGVSISIAQENGPAKGPPPGGDAAGRMADFMKRADADGDGKISKEEFVGMSRKETDERFTRADGNGDGFIDQTEFAQVAQRMRDAGGGTRRPSSEGGPRPVGEGNFRRPSGATEGGNPPPEASRSPGRPEGGRPGFGGAGAPEGGRPGFGGRGMFGDPKESFKRMDADGNGSVSETEYMAAMSKLREMMSRSGTAGQGVPAGPSGEGGFRRPGPPEGGRAPGGSEGGFRRPPVEDAKPEGQKPAEEKPRGAA